MSYKCSVCGCEFKSGGTIPHGTTHILCDNCGQLLYTCGTCKHVHECTSDCFITRIVQRGNVIFQKRIINPEGMRTCENYEMEEYEK